MAVYQTIEEETCFLLSRMLGLVFFSTAPNMDFQGPICCCELTGSNSLYYKTVQNINYTHCQWHGVRRRLTCWFDGPAYITQCPIQAGQNFKYRFTLLNQRGTLFWHAYISWLRATVHGPLIIYPKQGVGYPFQPPVEEHVIILGEYWLRDVQGLERHVKESGGGPPGSDAYTLNGLPGPLHNCSRDDVYTINVSKGKNYLLRIINAALNMEHFFMVANHTMTVVETDGEYTKPFKTTFLMLTPGQTYNVLIKADLSIGKNMAMAPYMPAKNVPFLMKTSCGILRYASPTVKVDKLAQKSPFSDQVKRLYPNHQWSPVDVPLAIDNWTQRGPDGGIFAASVNNVTFRRPMVSLLNAYYNNLQGYYSTDFPDKPEKMYDFVNGAPNKIIFQDTGTVGTEKHPIHLHGFSFYLLGTGLGNYNSTTALLNLYDPSSL
ncbi:hypothetical protein ES332_A11G210000v1 [Gossypium tomentosum]|uniref:laccase n=1 Tax=Gossypium tomentosum TaxID=34277 RepID=A0A5D2NDY2_GOSTO|nr:hypothetical protein ES332_A11G210000v1 [Gossypium tomentosum]